MATVTEPKSKEKNGVVFFDEPWEVSLSDWFSLHEESDYIADKLDGKRIRIYCYAKDASYNAEFEKVARELYPQRVIHSGIGVTFGGIWA
ncbi:MAG: hypothetical protein J5829_06045 [Lachnospiraceae bacterium]|nr:hypothetical protein [Lachnospiraceae bacterium]